VLIFPIQGCIDGVFGDEILITPPLVISHGEIDEMISVLDEALAEVEGELL